MIEYFYLIDCMKNPTREQSMTKGKQIGEQFLEQYINNDNRRYCGYIVEEGQFAPFWRLGVIPKRMVQDLYKLVPTGYIGKVKTCHNSY